MPSWGGSSPKPGTMRARGQGDNRPAQGSQAQRQPSAPRPRRDPGTAPNGYRQEYWHLAQYFIQTCEAHGVPTKGVPIVYEEIKRRAEYWNLESGSTAVEWDVRRPRPAEYRNKPLPKDWNATVRLRDLYRDEDNQPLTWVQVGEAIIDWFWDSPVIAECRTSDVLHDLCDLENFGYLYSYVCDRWRYKRSRKKFDEFIAKRQAEGYEPQIRQRRPRTEV